MTAPHRGDAGEARTEAELALVPQVTTMQICVALSSATLACDRGRSALGPATVITTAVDITID